jgi:hypothetical protein
MTLCDEVLDREVTARHVVDRHRVDPVVAHPVDQHCPDAAVGEAPHAITDVADRRDEHAGDPLLLEQVEVRGLAGGVLVAVAQGERESGLRGGILGSPRDVGEERIAHVEHHHADGRAAPVTELARGIVADEAELRDRGIDPRHGVGRHLLGMIHRVGHRAHRHACPLRDLLDAHDHASYSIGAT